MHRIFLDLNQAIVQHLGIDSVIEINGMPLGNPVDLWEANSDKDIPTVVQSVSTFFSDRNRLGTNDEYTVLGLTVTDTAQQEFWELLFSNTEEAAMALIQVKNMGSVIDAYLNETQMYPYFLKHYYKVLDEEHT